MGVCSMHLWSSNAQIVTAMGRLCVRELLRWWG